MTYHPYLPSSFTTRAAQATGLSGHAADDPFHSYLYQPSVVDTARSKILALPAPTVKIVPISHAPSARPEVERARDNTPLILLNEYRRLTYGNLAIWLAEQPPADIIGRRRRRSQSVMQRFLDEHHGGLLPAALESWAYVYEYLLNSQDPVYPLVTTHQALKALRDPLVIRALGWGKVPDDIIAA